MASAKILGLLSTGAVLTAVSIVAAAGPGSNSPFANKKPKAWEVPTQPATQSQFRSQIQTKSTVQVPSQVKSQYQKPNASYGGNLAGGNYYPGKKPAAQSPNIQRPQVASPNVQTPYVQSPQTAPSVQVPAWANKTYQEARQHRPAKSSQVKPPYGQQPGQVPAWAQEGTQGGTMGGAQTQNSSGYQPAYEGIPGYGAQQQSRQQQAPAYAQNYGAYRPATNGQPQYAQSPQSVPALRGASKPSWLQRLGLGNLQTVFSGHAKAGVAAVDRSGAEIEAESIIDLDARLEVSAITDGGLEYGAGLRARAQRDRHRRGFGGRVGDCPAGVADCASVLVGADTRAIKGHTSQFYNSGNDDRRETEVALEGAYLFLRSAYGDLVVGRDDGSAYLFSIGAPSLVAVSASNSSVDYTGLDSVKTFNDASGFAEKIAYTSPRLLGDTVGVGVQVGLSYAPNARACGVDYCVKSNTANALDPFAPQIENVFEAGVALDRKFANGLSAELTGTYARGSEDSGLAVFDRLESYGLGLELKYADFTFGSSFLKSNNGFAGQGDYVAYDAGITWKPSNWGLTASYGHADDDIAHITSDQGVLALSYDLGKVRLGTGVQYVRRDVPLVIGAVRTKEKEDAAALFIEAGIDF